MADRDTTHVPLTDDQRYEALWKLWDAMIERLLAAMTSDKPARASMLDVTRKFLSDQGIDARSRPDMRRGLRALGDLRNLPFKENGDPH